MSVNIVIAFTCNLYHLLVSEHLVIVILTLSTLCLITNGFVVLFKTQSLNMVACLLCTPLMFPFFFIFNTSQPVWRFVWCLSHFMSYLCKCSYVTLEDSKRHIGEVHLKCLRIIFCTESDVAFWKRQCVVLRPMFFIISLSDFSRRRSVTYHSLNSSVYYMWWCRPVFRLNRPKPVFTKHSQLLRLKSM